MCNLVITDLSNILDMIQIGHRPVSRHLNRGGGVNVPLSVVQNFKIRPFNMPKIIISSKRGGGGEGSTDPLKPTPRPLVNGPGLVVDFGQRKSWKRLG